MCLQYDVLVLITFPEPQPFFHTQWALLQVGGM